MKIGYYRKRLAAILTEITGAEYLAENITQANITFRRGNYHDHYYWDASGGAGILSSFHTMKQIVEAYDNGEKVSKETNAVWINWKGIHRW